MKPYSFLFCIIIFSSCKNPDYKAKGSESSALKEKATDIVKENDDIYKGWKDAKGDKVSFKYPADWYYEKKEYPKVNWITATPKEFADIDGLKMFEVTEFDAKDISFKEFEQLAFGSFSQRTGGRMRVLNNATYNFKGLEAKKIELNYDATNDELPAFMYLINAKNTKYYVVIFMNNPEDMEPLNVQNKSILNSIIFYQ